MKRKALPALAALGLLLAGAHAAPAQTPPPAPEPPIGFTTTFFDGGNFLGVHVEDVTRENASRYNLSGEPRGVGVSEVVKGSPAERAGVRKGDVILRFDGEQVTSVRKLNRLIAESAPERAVRVTVLRSGSEQEISATLARRERLEPAVGHIFNSDELGRLGEVWRRDPGEWGLRGEELNRRLEELRRANPEGFTFFGAGRRIGVATSSLGKQLADYFGVTGGVLVNSVEAGSPAERAGLKAGDVITDADGAKVEDAEDLVRAISKKDDGDVSLTVVRDKQRRTVRVTPEKRKEGGYFINPGSFRVLPPVASVAPSRVMTLPRAAVAPRAVVAPRVRTAPMRVLRPGRRVL